MQAKAGHASAWILLSIAYAARSKPAHLADIIAAADFINHAIVTHAELSRAIRNLQELELILCEGSQFRASQQVLERLSGRRSTVEADLERIKALLRDRDQGPRVAASRTIDESEFEEAANRYLRGSAA